jgi:hypothetical protein
VFGCIIFKKCHFGFGSAEVEASTFRPVMNSRPVMNFRPVMNSRPVMIVEATALLDRVMMIQIIKGF